MNKEMLVRKINWAMQESSADTLKKLYGILLALNRLQNRR